MSTLMYCLPLAEYLEDIIRFHSYAVIDHVRAERLRFTDPKEELLHIEPGENSACFKVYRKKDWLQEYEHWKQAREESERLRQKMMAKAVVVGKLNKLITEKTGIVATDSLSQLVSLCITQAAMLREFGLTPEEIEVLQRP